MTRQEHGCNLPNECDRCGCPRFQIVRQYKTRGIIHAVWKCDYCYGMNRTQTKNTWIDKKHAEDAAENGIKRRGKRPPEKRNWW
jgi:hypothetical protein